MRSTPARPERIAHTFTVLPASDRYKGMTTLQYGTRTIKCVGTGPEVEAACLELAMKNRS